jgi:hypothetical protein
MAALMVKVSAEAVPIRPDIRTEQNNTPMKFR